MKNLTYAHVHGNIKTYVIYEEIMHISLTKFRVEMFKILPRLKEEEELTVTFEGKDAYIIKKVSNDRQCKIKEALSKCKKLNLGFEEMLSFKNEGRR
ncbi:MAG: hypothetical protein K6C34_01540 [Alphaproteobacteria bacterium]|nr:hypothetical protein [Alphaproteobacteria bacterium]